MAIALEGKALARDVRKACRERADGFARVTGRKPHLFMLVAGDDPASAIYVRNKEKACVEAGIEATTMRYPADVTEVKLCIVIDTLNRADYCDGIMVQMPLPAHINAQRVLEHITPAKDVDGLTNANQGKLITGQKGLIPCTAKGVLRLLTHHGIALEGRSCAIFGRSTLVGKPLAALLTNENMTVTLAHRKTDEITRYNLMVDADIIVCAVGAPGFLRSENTGIGQVLIDVGINRLEDGRIVGDISENCYDDAYAYTPVPGGVGPMTVAMLIENVIEAAEDRLNA